MPAVTEVKRSNFWANLFKVPTDKSELEDILLLMPPFQNLSRKELNSLMQLMHNRCYEPGELIFSQGDPGIGLYIIQDGDVKIERCSKSGKKVNLANFTKGDFFGELALLDEDTRSASAISLTKTKIAVIFKPDLDEYIDKYPKRGIKIVRGISQIVTTRLRNVNEDFVTLYLKEFNEEKEV